ncbi:MAG: hypothetical protein WCG00_10595 [Hyphomicrobiales bacterium]
MPMVMTIRADLPLKIFHSALAWSMFVLRPAAWIASKSGCNMRSSVYGMIEAVSDDTRKQWLREVEALGHDAL